LISIGDRNYVLLGTLMDRRGVLRGGGANIIALPDNMIRKGQIAGIGRGEIQRQVKSVSNLFGIAA
jgi:hypothetical protein